MKTAELAGNADEKSRLRSKCKQLLSRAEEIKKLAKWPPKKRTAVLESKRAISKREEIILLEGSRLHGFIFPPWRADPDDSVFVEKTKDGKYTYVLTFPSMKVDLTWAGSLRTSYCLKIRQKTSTTGRDLTTIPMSQMIH